MRKSCTNRKTNKQKRAKKRKPKSQRAVAAAATTTVRANAVGRVTTTTVVGKRKTEEGARENTKNEMLMRRFNKWNWCVIKNTKTKRNPSNQLLLPPSSFSPSPSCCCCFHLPPVRTHTTPLRFTVSRSDGDSDSAAAAHRRSDAASGWLYWNAYKPQLAGYK